jgi:4-carboxymuconolactone decarboxylase
MAILASLIAQQTLGEYKVMFGGALNVGVTPIAVFGSWAVLVPLAAAAAVLAINRRWAAITSPARS